MEQALTQLIGSGVTGCICAYLLWERRTNDQERREERERREVREEQLERDRINVTQEHTKILSELSTLISTIVK